MINEVAKDIEYIGVDDFEVDLFEGQYKVPNGMCYNSYAIIDDYVAIMDSVDANFGNDWLARIHRALGDRKPDFLIVQHMEPDHSANIYTFMNAYPDATIVSSVQAFNMMNNFFGTKFTGRNLMVKEGDTLCLGKHTLHFVAAPMVHWPEVIFTYDDYTKVLFTADGFGKFGSYECEEPWIDEARRYYIGIVGKFGVNVQNVLKKAAGLEIETICPLHGPVLKENLGYYIDLYDKWSSYTPEQDGVCIAYTTVYGHTREAARELKEHLESQGTYCEIFDLARDDMSAAVASAFKLSKLALCTTTYNTDCYPFMKTFIHDLVDHNYQKRTVALIENGFWAPQAGKKMTEDLGTCKELNILETKVTIKGCLDDDTREAVKDLAKALK